MALAYCFLGKVLGVGYHYFPPPLDIPTFAARYLHVCTTREILVAKGGLLSGKFTRNDDFHTILGCFNAAKYDVGPTALLLLRRKAC